MANDQCARVTGVVLKVDERSGTKANQQTGELKAWKMTTARVLVGGADICDVTLSDRSPIPDRGDAVDWLVRIGKSGQYLNIDHIGSWTSEHSEASA